MISTSPFERQVGELDGTLGPRFLDKRTTLTRETAKRHRQRGEKDAHTDERQIEDTNHEQCQYDSPAEVRETVYNDITGDAAGMEEYNIERGLESLDEAERSEENDDLG